MSLYLRILGYLGPYRWVFLLSVLATSIYAALDAFSLALLIPFLQTLFADDGPAAAGTTGAGAFDLDRLMEITLGRFVDLAAPPDQAMRGIIVFLLVVFLVKNVFDYVRIYLVAYTEQGVTKDIRNGVYGHLVELDLIFFGRTRVGQIVSRLTHDVEQVRTLVTKELARIISSFFEMAWVIAFMVVISWKLTLVAFVVLPGVAIIWGPLLRRVRRGDRRVLDLAGDVNSHVQETMAGIRLVKASSAEEHERGRFRRLTQDYFKSFVRTERFRALSSPITESVAALGTVIVLWYGTGLVLSGGEISGAEFVGFLGLSMKLYAPVKYLGKLPAIILPGIVAAERAFEFLDAPVEVRDQPGAQPFPGLEREIVYDRVSFEYRPGERVLSDVSFRAPAGSVTALVGPSGAGKSTLVDLLGRFYDVTEGRILADGNDIRCFTIQSLRACLGMVSQETVLFHDTVRANIAYGMEGVREEAIEAAARAAHADQFISRLPSGYDTIVGERGTHLSGGQRQRIAIARAILTDPPILILDEATSALDSESERLVQAAMERLFEGRSVFVIAHRLSTVQRAHQILVMDEGRIVQAGSHESLLAEGGLYGRLHRLQFQGEGEVTEPATRRV